MPDRLRRPILLAIARENIDFARGVNVDEFTITTPESPPHADAPPESSPPYVTFDELQEFTRRALASPQSVLQLFTIRETAEIISKSYHTTRNMALRGEFGTLSTSADADDASDGATYVTREGLLAYLDAEVIETGQIHDDAVDARERLLGGTVVPDDATDDVTEPGGMALDVTDEAANMSQAFQNVAGAFDAMANTVTEHHTTTQDQFLAVIREMASMRDLLVRRTEVPTTTQLSQTLDAIATQLAAIRGDIRRRIPATVLTLTGGGGAGDSAHPATPAPPIPWSTPPRLLEPAESSATPASESPTPAEIPSYRPDQIVVIADHSTMTRHTFRTRRALSVGELIAADGNGDIHRASGDETILGVVIAIRNAVSDAEEIVQPLQTIEMWNSDRAEILHPWRSETAILTTDQSGHPEFAARTDHFVIENWVAADHGGRRRVTIQWRAS